MQSKLGFFGGVGAVTGSNFVLDTGGLKIVVDCGLRQGLSEERNWDAFAYQPSRMTHLVVTHAHLDHVGRIPKLVADGFRGQIISTKATKALCEPMLLDALEILERAGRKSGRPALYAEADVERTMGLWRTLSYNERVELGDDVSLELYDAGHILGSAMARFERGAHSIVFTGDIGGGNSPLLNPTADLPATTYAVMESTYGDRARPEDKERLQQLEDALEEAATRGGTLLIPAFSTERTQDLLFDIGRLMREKRVPQLAVYLDSPLAQKITAAYLQCPEYFSPEVRARVEGGEDIFSFPQLKFVERPKESEKLNQDPEQKIILAGAGMSSGGRVIAHEAAYLPDPKSTLLIVGYQAAGTLGRQLVEGAKEVRMFKETVPVRAKVQTLYGYSAHRDQEGLFQFASDLADRGAEEVFCVHGEPAAAGFLSQRVRDYLGVKASVPEEGSTAVLEF